MATISLQRANAIIGQIQAMQAHGGDWTPTLLERLTQAILNCDTRTFQQIMDAHTHEQQKMIATAQNPFLAMNMATFAKAATYISDYNRHEGLPIANYLQNLTFIYQ